MVAEEDLQWSKENSQNKQEDCEKCVSRVAYENYQRSERLAHDTRKPESAEEASSSSWRVRSKAEVFLIFFFHFLSSDITCDVFSLLQPLHSHLKSVFSSYFLLSFVLVFFFIISTCFFLIWLLFFSLSLLHLRSHLDAGCMFVLMLNGLFSFDPDSVYAYVFRMNQIVLHLQHMGEVSFFRNWQNKCKMHFAQTDVNDGTSGKQIEGDMKSSQSNEGEPMLEFS